MCTRSDVTGCTATTTRTTPCSRAILSVQNILDGTTHDVWQVNVEDDYHEEQTGRAGGPATALRADAGSSGS